MEIDKRIKEVVFSAEEIKNKIIELSHWVNETYKTSDNLVIVGLLKGSLPFLAELIKHLNVDHVIDFIVASSYFGKTKSSGNIKIVMDLNYDIYQKDILIIEDIIDSGITLDRIKTNLLERKPRSLKIMTLLDKPYKRKVDLNADVYGFQAPDEFLVGFGLDVKEKLRNLPYVGIFDKKYLNKL